jgi:hypothetical protein
MGFRGVVVTLCFLAAALLDVLGPAAAPRMAAPRPAGDTVVQGTIAWANRDGTEIMLKDGTRLYVPPRVNVSRSSLTPPHSIKAYVRNEGGRRMVTLIEVQALHPGGGGSSSG